MFTLAVKPCYFSVGSLVPSVPPMKELDMLPRKTVGVFFLLALVWLASAPMLAQTSMGGVNGTVTDSQGAVLPGATVTLTSEDTNVATVRQTNGSGYFVFVNVRPGPYVLTVELQGLKTARVDRFIVGVNETVARNVTLQVGQVTEVVQVKGGTSELLQTTSAALGQVIEQKLIRELPSQGRNFTSLLLLTPGVNPVSTAQGPGQNGGNETAVNSIEGNSGIPGGNIFNASIQGQQNRSKIYYMDGIVNTSVRAGSYVALPDIDSLQEFKVQSQSDKAEFGGVLGGVVNMTSKSGTNRFTGSTFGIGRNEKFAARNPFRDFNRSDHPKFRQSQYRRQPRRACAQEQDVLLRIVRWLAVHRYRERPNYRAVGQRTERRLLTDVPRPGHLQPVYDAHREQPSGPRSVPE